MVLLKPDNQLMLADTATDGRRSDPLRQERYRVNLLYITPLGSRSRIFCGGRVALQACAP